MGQSARYAGSCHQMSTGPDSYGADRYTTSGIPLKPVYTVDDIAGLDRRGNRDGIPGSPPFLRGPYPGMYRTKPWRIFQLSGFGSPEDEGERIKFLIQSGETGFIMEHDRNTADHLYDVDHPEVVARREDVGLTGAVILSARDYETVLKDIQIDQLYAHPGGGVVQHAPFALACYWTVAGRRAIPLESLAGTGQADFFLTYLGCIAKEQIPTQAGLRMNVDTIEFCIKHLPRWVPVSIAGYNGAETGLNGYQELAAVLANAVEYLDLIKERGRYSVAEAASGVAGVSFRVSMNLFEDVAKLRAARRMWHDLLRDRYDVSDQRATRLRIHSLTSGSAMTYQQPLNNVVRGTIMALAGVLGGSQSLGVSAYDEAISAPSEHAHQMSVRIQQILQCEAGLTDVADPLGGSYLIESLTGSLEERAWSFFNEILAQGGFLASLDSGWLHARATENQLHEASDIESKTKRLVGVNFADSDIGTFRFDGFAGTLDAWEKALLRLNALRRTRAKRRHSTALRNLRAVCISGSNVMPAMMEAVEADATLGEIGDIFRDVFGNWNVPIKF